MEAAGRGGQRFFRPRGRKKLALASSDEGWNHVSELEQQKGETWKKNRKRHGEGNGNR